MSSVAGQWLGWLVGAGALESQLLQQPFQRGADGGYPGEPARLSTTFRCPDSSWRRNLLDEQGWGGGQGGKVVDDRAAGGRVNQRCDDALTCGSSVWDDGVGDRLEPRRISSTPTGWLRRKLLGRRLAWCRCSSTARDSVAMSFVQSLAGRAFDDRLPWHGEQVWLRSLPRRAT